MKRLLLPLLSVLALPTAVNANLFSNDLIVKTPLGEKYIIKGKSIQRENYKQEDFINGATSIFESKKINNAEIKKLEKKIDEINAYGYVNDLLYQECVDKRPFYFTDNKESRKYIENCRKKSNNLYAMNKERREIERKPFEEEILKIELKNKQIDEKILLLKDEYKTNTITGIHVQRLIFKPIYNDLNNKKIILNQFAAFCLNPKLTEIPKLFWEDTKLVNDEYNDADLSTLIEQKVCKKFAKF